MRHNNHLDQVPRFDRLSSHQADGFLIGSIACAAEEKLYLVEAYGEFVPLCLDGYEYAALVKAGVDAQPHANHAHAGAILETVKVGVVAPLGGGAARYGEDILAGARLAESDFNAGLAEAGAAWRLELSVIDGMTSGAAAALAVDRLSDRGYSLVAGPSIDAFGGAVPERAAAAGTLLLSCCSVTLENAAADYLFRMTPPQDVHGGVLARVMWDDGIRHIVPAGRDAPWVADLLASAAERFAELGGTASEPVLYGAGGDFSFGETVLLDFEVIGAIREAGDPRAVAVLYVGFGETFGFIDQSVPYGRLDSVRWYGADANTILPPGGAPDLSAARIVNFTSVQPAVPATEASLEAFGSVADALGRDPSVYAFQAYDAVTLLGDAVRETGRHDAASVARYLLEAELPDGLGGPVSFDANGDRADMRYAVWRVAGQDWAVVDARSGSDPAAKPDCEGIVNAHPLGLLRALEWTLLGILGGTVPPDAASVDGYCAMLGAVGAAVESCAGRGSGCDAAGEILCGGTVGADCVLERFGGLPGGLDGLTESMAAEIGGSS